MISAMSLPLKWKGNLSTIKFIIAASLINTVIYHYPLLSFAVANLNIRSSNGVLTLITVLVLVTFITALILSLLSLASERIIKPLLMVAAVGNSIALYFVQSYNVILDKSMMGNVFNTDISEATSLLHPHLLLYVALLGAIPCILIYRTEINGSSFVRRSCLVIAVLILGLGWSYVNSNTALWFSKNGKHLGGLIMPWSYTINGGRHLASTIKPGEQRLLPDATAREIEKTVVILLIGEAARSDNFSLYGYPRLTKPEMAKAGAIALPNTKSCATYTTASLLCILSHLEDGDSSWGTTPKLPAAKWCRCNLASQQLGRARNEGQHISTLWRAP